MFESLSYHSSPLVLIVIWLWNLTARFRNFRTAVRGLALFQIPSVGGMKSPLAAVLISIPLRKLSVISCQWPITARLFITRDTKKISVCFAPCSDSSGGKSGEVVCLSSPSWAFKVSAEMLFPLCSPALSASLTFLCSLIFLHLCFFSSLLPLGQNGTKLWKHPVTVNSSVIFGWTVILMSSKRSTKHRKKSIIKIVHMTFGSHTTNTDQSCYLLKPFPSTELLTFDYITDEQIIQTGFVI